MIPFEAPDCRPSWLPSWAYYHSRGCLLGILSSLPAWLPGSGGSLVRSGLVWLSFVWISRLTQTLESVLEKFAVEKNATGFGVGFLQTLGVSLGACLLWRSLLFERLTNPERLSTLAILGPIYLLAVWWAFQRCQTVVDQPFVEPVRRRRPALGGVCRARKLR